ncbi:peptide-methionine (R)-S-oxide reductase MsrB [Vibrio sp. SM6]|uniref:Multifunctional fusion protein n=1 Tax=Vibrio agarilyticus TaxID=2726741 RepID=A0A7X8TN44_9VIBR|nr:peptide-methionine (R)-S-oxide reductase MsrB [Vibrio agarilyticus]NLS11817.1 peptide-methionine (R)-S-oxide reductase MsrB [Vibrio agarilyticus]
MKKRGFILLSTLSLALSLLTLVLMPTPHATANTQTRANNIETATLAGGCFWCTEADLEQLPGVIDVISGYAGGSEEDAQYRKVASGNTDHIEVIQVTYDANQLSYTDVLDYFLRHIDPTDAKGSFVDRGAQYRPAIFYHNKAQFDAATSLLSAVDAAGIYPKPLQTELIEYQAFYPAESYHQDYYKKSRLKYKYYRQASGRDAYLDSVFGDDRKSNPVSLRSRLGEQTQTLKPYTKPSQAEIKAMLTELQYYVTQEEGTERAFDNPYWDNKEEGIYVDIVSGEPLFSSTDKYRSGTGWPSFTKPIDSGYIVTKKDFHLFYPRMEVRSRYGDSHLGHVFEDGPEPTGLRYCMNSAAMRFVPKQQMQAQGYAKYLYLFE